MTASIQSPVRPVSPTMKLFSPPPQVSTNAPPPGPPTAGSLVWATLGAATAIQARIAKISFHIGRLLAARRDGQSSRAIGLAGSGVVDPERLRPRRST